MKWRLSQERFDHASLSSLSYVPIADCFSGRVYLVDLPGPLSAQGQTLSGRDTVLTYDTYGNPVTQTSYAGPSTRLFNGSTWSIGPAGGSSPVARTTTTEYESIFYVFPTKVTRPAVNSIAQVEQADYDYRMGALIKVVGPLGNPAAVDCRATSFSIPATEMTTCARYDVLGRMRILVKPGASISTPSAQTVYDDAAIPFRFMVETFTGTGDKRRIQKFYDGIGQQIQVKSESVDDLQNIVEDTVYNGLGQVVKQSQARYVTEDQPAIVPTSSYWLYTPWDSDANMRWTTMTYDTLGRPLVTIAPDGTSSGIRSEHHYGIVTGTITLATAGGIVTKTTPLAYDDQIDPNRHRIQTRADAFGRLVETNELDGDCGYWGYTCTGATTELWAPYTKTRYGYNGADQLTDVFDAQNNHSRMFYDSLGRKTSMIDPDMGAWSYQYDIGGNLVQQTDARSQTLWFGYDALNRLTEKRQNNASGTLLASYGYDETTLLADGQPRYGLGQRTSMTTGSATTRWRYDARGRKVREEYTVTGLTGTRAFQWSYDSADRITTITYPSGEVLSYSYDAASRPTSICSSLSGNPCYASGAQYNALNQPMQWTLDNALVQQWQYSNPAQRLITLQVGSGSAPGSVLDRHYTYDSGGNILTLQDTISGQTQYFSYDHRDRLRFAATSPVPSGMAFGPQRRHAMASGGRGVGLAAPLPPENDIQALPQTISPLNWRQFDADPTLAFESTTAGPDHDPAESAKSRLPATGMMPTNTAPQTSTLDVDRLPLNFFPNRGQTHKNVRFQAQTVGGALFFTPDGVTLALPGAAQHKLKDSAADASRQNKPGTDVLTSTVVRVRFEGTNGAAAIRGDDPQPGVVNFLNGADKTKWKANLPTYAGLIYDDLYPGIDLHYIGNAGELKGTYQVAAGADPAGIRWRYQGATNIQLDQSTGDLLITLPTSSADSIDSTLPAWMLRERAPIAWQDIGDQRVPVTVRYTLAPDGSIGFAVGRYDPAVPLTIDPTLVYSTFLGGGAGTETGYAIALDSTGNMYVTGSTQSAGFPTTTGAYDASFNGKNDVFVSKLNASGTLAYSTFLGGTDDDIGRSIAVDGSGNIYLTGETRSSTFPTTAGAYDTSHNGINDLFMSKLDASGALTYSTFLGGSGGDTGYGIVVDGSGNIYLTGITGSSTFPTTAGAYDTSINGGSDAFVTKLNASGTLVYSTFFGGSNNEESRSIAVDASEDIYLTGYTQSTNLPTTAGAYDTSYNGSYDVFVSKLNASGTLAYSTFFGTSGIEFGYDIAVDGSGNAFLTGFTDNASFPTTAGAYDTSYNGAYDVFVSKLNTSGALAYSTFLGGTAYEAGNSITLDASGNIYLTGYTQSSAFPTSAGAYDTTLTGSADVFMTKLSTTGTLAYSTFLGGGGSMDAGYGITLDGSGNIYLIGQTDHGSFPTTAGAYDTTQGGSWDVFVTKLSASGTLAYGTLLGDGGFDNGYGIALDGSGNVYLTGSTDSASFPTTSGAYDTTLNNSYDIIVSKLNASGTLVYSTFLGGTGNDFGRSIAVDGSGNTYLTGYTDSTNFPTTAGAYDASFNGINDGFVSKLNASGSGLIYSTFLGGSVLDSAYGIAVDGSGNAYLTGQTASTDFPTTAGAHDTSFNGAIDVFMSKLNATGSALIYSTFLGGSGSDTGYGIAVDGSGNSNLTGSTSSTNFPTTAGAHDTCFNGTNDVFMSKLNTTGTLSYSTFLGGSGDDIGYGIAVDGNGNSYLTGYTQSNDFPTTAGAYDTSHNGSSDVFASKLSTTGTLAYSTFLGGSGSDRGYGIAADGSGNSYVTGETYSTNFPTTADAYDSSQNGGSDVFASKLNMAGTPAYSTFLGGSSTDIGYSIAVNPNGGIYLMGTTYSSNFPTTTGAYDTSYNGGTDLFLVNLAPQAPPTYNDEYTYDTLGNLTSKPGLGAYIYGATVSGCATGTPASKPHAVVQAGSITFSYDCNGNMLDGGGRIYTWDAENRPNSIAHVSGTESYTYDADGERVTKSNGSVTTFYLGGGLWEEDSTGATKTYYSFNGQIVALREATGVSYLHSDHLGSVSVVTNHAGAVVSRQYFDPWGKVRAGGIGQTSLNYTGQRLDITGLLYYHARMYDPALGRFISADSVVPGNASGSMEGIALKPLTVDFHEVGFVVSLNQENQQPFWFQMSKKQRQKVGTPWGPVNPQALNRYSYVQNNPLKHTDPTGHCLWDLCLIEGATVVAIIVEVVIPAVVGAAVIAGAWTAGGELAKAQNAAATEPNTEANDDQPVNIPPPRPHLDGPAQNLPTGGTHPYVPPKQKGNPEVVKVRGGGYLDKKGNVWKRDPSMHGGEHWDVQHPDGSHTNVYPDGEVHQGKDNF